MINDLVADLLTRIRNAQRAKHAVVHVMKSKMVERVLNLLKEEGFVEDFSERDISDIESPSASDKNQLTVYLKYYPNGLPVIKRFNRVSKSGRRVYVEADQLNRVQSGLGISILSTSEGVMSDKDALKKKIGGELIATLS